MKRAIAAGCLLFILLVLLTTEPALAGPGGKIAKTLFDNFWGRILLIVLAVIFLPLIIYVLVRQKLAERRTRQDLRFMAARDSRFDWLKLQERVKDCFYRVHSGWRDEDLSQVTEWMTQWYWQNQQMVYLDRWKREGLTNVCDVKKIKKLKPLLFVHRNQELDHEDSMLVVLIEARMKDYLKQNSTGKVVEGNKRYKDVETVWAFTMEDGTWKVSDIEDASMSLEYAKLAKDLPPIESTVSSEPVR